MQQAYIASFSPEEESDDYDPIGCNAVETLDAKYAKADIDLVVEQQKHLTPTQRQELKDLLVQFPTLFNGKLGHYAILKLKTPQSLTEARSFIGAVNFYRDMCPKRSHILNPLHELTGLAKKAKFEWLPKHDKAFEQMRAVLAKDAYVRCPDHNLPFHVYTDASDLQLGAVIMQQGKPVAYYSRKLNSAQRNYATMEKELLSIVETFREFRTMLYGCRELHVHTDHKNLTYANLNSQRALRWRLFIEEYNPIFHYIEGERNTMADALSRLPMEEKGVPGKFPVTRQMLSHAKRQSTGDDQALEDESYAFTSSLMEDDELLHCFVNFPEVDIEHPFALSYDHIADKQKLCDRLQQNLQKDPRRYSLADIGNKKAMMIYRETDKSQPRICIPDSMLDAIASFHHRVLGHTGSSRVIKSINKFFIHPDVDKRCKELIDSCEPCQLYKQQRQQHGELPERMAGDAPWSDIAVDLVGPWEVRDKDGALHKFTALTVIDTVTNYVELVRLKSKTAEHVSQQFINCWLSRYPRPNQVIFDPGPEFKGKFRETLTKFNVAPAPTSVKNPQANAICERMHQTVADILRPIIHADPPDHYDDAAELIDNCIAAASYACRASLHSTMDVSPGQVAFNRDVLLDVPVIADFALLQKNRQMMIDKNLARANRRRVAIDYQPGDEALKLVYKPNKLEPRAVRPFVVERVHVNGTLTVRVSKYVTQRINIRKLRPFNRLLPKQPIATNNQLGLDLTRSSVPGAE